MADPISSFTVPANQVGLVNDEGVMPGTAPGTTDYHAFLPASDDPTALTGWGTSDGKGYITSFTFEPDANNSNLIHVYVDTTEGEVHQAYGNVTLSGDQSPTVIAFSPDPNAQEGTDLAGFGLLVSNTTLPFAFDSSSGLLTVDETLSNTGQPFVACFATGTLILTSRGEVPVEQLQVGDLAVTSSGELRPIRWIGHRRFNCCWYPHKNDVWPVRIQAGAFGPDQPSRDLLLSPGHAVMVRVLDELLIPVSKLINGATIQQEKVDEITYWHVELDTPDVLVANGLPAESYIDVGNRASLTSDDTPVSNLFFSETTPEGIEYARPRMEHGEVVQAVRSRLSARAAAAGWTLESGFAGFHALVDGEAVQPQIHAGKARFLIPATAKDVRLVAAASAPWAIEGTGDARLLGVAINGLVLDDGLTDRREIALDDPRLARGFFALEHGSDGRPFRWTGAEAVLPASLWEGCAGMFFLQVSLVAARPRWVAPASVEAAPRSQQVSGF